MSIWGSDSHALRFPADVRGSILCEERSTGDWLERPLDFRQHLTKNNTVPGLCTVERLIHFHRPQYRPNITNSSLKLTKQRCITALRMGGMAFLSIILIHPKSRNKKNLQRWMSVYINSKARNCLFLLESMKTRAEILHFDSNSCDQ